MMEPSVQLRWPKGQDQPNSADIRRAISSAGGVAAGEFDENFRLRKFPNTYLVGEMVDWDAAHGRLFIAGVFFIGLCRGEGDGRRFAHVSGGFNSPPR